MNLIMSAGLWAVVVLSIAALGLALFTLLASHGHYTVLHVRRSELSLIPEQVLNSQRLTRVHFLGQVLTAAAIISATVLLIVYAVLVV